MSFTYLQQLLRHMNYMLTVADLELTRDLLRALRVIVQRCWIR